MPKNVTDAVGGYRLYSTLWGYSRKDPPAAKDIWTRMYAASLFMPLSKSARLRLRWFFDCATKFQGNVRKTCRYHGIPRKTFYKWRKRFDVRNPRSLEDESRRPKYGKLPVIHLEQVERIFKLRSRYPCYSKMKIAVLYKRLYGEKVSYWQIQKVIERFKLYRDPARAKRIASKRKKAVKKQRILNCRKEAWTGWLFSIDTITLYVLGHKIYILTAIDRYSRLLFTRAYKSHSSKAAADFLEQLVDFAGNKVQNIHTDNGSEFHDLFEQTAKRLRLNHWWSRVRTPKDNAQNERVNRTIEEEFLPAYSQCTDVDELNQGLVAWMTEYNHDRPHAALGYKTPYEVACASPNPLPAFREWEDEEFELNP